MESKVIDDRYEIIKLVDAGGTSHVYRAVDRKTKNIVAVKVLKRDISKDIEFVQRFETEVQAALTLEHNNIVKVLDAGTFEDSYYLVMEFIEGKTLKQMVRENGALDMTMAVEITIDVCNALDHAHAEGFVHRDIKPANILVQKDGQVKITDFGIARNTAVLEQTSKKNTVLGSVQYIPPEQIRGEKTDQRTDIYSLGISLYEMITGSLPFEGETSVETALKHLNERIPQPKLKKPTINDALNKIVLKATRKNKRSRYNSVKAFADDLKRCFEEPDGKYVQLDPERLRPSKAEQKKFQKRWVWSIVGLGTMAVAVALVLVMLAVFGTRSNAQATAPVPITIPSFFGLSETTVTESAAEYGLQISRLYDYSEDIAEGKAIRQNPEAGSTVQPNAVVEVTFSLGLKMVTMPDLSNQTLEEARDMLTELGLVIGDIEYIASDQPSGYIVAQDPMTDESVPEGETVNLSVSKIIDLTKAVVPDFTGMTIDEVKAAFAELDFEKCLVYLEPGEDGGAHKKAGIVLNQTPYKDTEEEVTSPIYVWIGAFPEVFRATEAFAVTVEQADTLVRVTLVEEDSPIEYVMMESKLGKGTHGLEVVLTSYEAKEKYMRVYVNEILVKETEITSWGRIE